MVDMIGKKFNRLLVLEYSHKDKSRSLYWKCICDCGNKTIVKGTYLRNGKTKSCGCLQKEIISEYAKNNNYKKTKIKIENITKKVGGFIVNEDYSLDLGNFIYKLTNIFNNKIYIGKCETNLKKHLARYNKFINANKPNRRYIDKALIKYGLNSFIFEIIYICNNDDINQKETYYINLLKSNNPEIGYNLTTGGEGTRGLKVSDETKKKISKSRIGKYTGENNPFFGKKHSLKSKEKIIESNKRRGKKNL